jgi:signal transduction histidine kinase
MEVKARDDFISIAAHELRNPMTPMIGQIGLLRKSTNKAGNEVPPDDGKIMSDTPNPSPSQGHA